MSNISCLIATGLHCMVIAEWGIFSTNFAKLNFCWKFYQSFQRPVLCLPEAEDCRKQGRLWHPPGLNPKQWFPPFCQCVSWEPQKLCSTLELIRRFEMNSGHFQLQKKKFTRTEVSSYLTALEWFCLRHWNHPEMAFHLTYIIPSIHIGVVNNPRYRMDGWIRFILSVRTECWWEAVCLVLPALGRIHFHRRSDIHPTRNKLPPAVTWLAEQEVLRKGNCSASKRTIREWIWRSIQPRLHSITAESLLCCKRRRIIWT